MTLKRIPLVLIVISIAINEIFAYDKDQIHQGISDGSIEDKLKLKFGCIPTNDWNLIGLNSDSGVVQNVCISSMNYIHDPPSVESLVKVTLILWNKKILEIDERGKSISILIGASAHWQDPRFKVENSTIKRSIKLPPISRTRKLFWTPLTDLRFIYLKDFKVVKDPIIADVELQSGRYVNKLLSRERFRAFPFSFVFDPDSAVVFASTKWRMKISCNFDFSKYPFDRHTMSLMDQRHTIQFGVDNNFIRQIDAYFYQCYVPCIFIVTMSFSSFIIPVTAIPGRVAIIVTQFLTLTNIFIHQMVSLFEYQFSRKI